MDANKIHSFVDLITWRKAHEFALEIYKVTKEFPREERFGLVDQIRRASVSITSNIAEGFARRTAADKTHFYFLSLSSLSEAQNQLFLAKDLDYIAQEKFNQLMDLSIEVRKLTSKLVKSTSTRF